MTTEQDEALAVLRRASAAHSNAEEARRAAILAARATGATYRSIAADAGLALSHVHAIAAPTRR